MASSGTLKCFKNPHMLYKCTCKFYTISDYHVESTDLILLKKIFLLYDILSSYNFPKKSIVSKCVSIWIVSTLKLYDFSLIQFLRQDFRQFFVNLSSIFCQFWNPGFVYSILQYLFVYISKYLFTSKWHRCTLNPLQWSLFKKYFCTKNLHTS